MSLIFWQKQIILPLWFLDTTSTMCITLPAVRFLKWLILKNQWLKNELQVRKANLANCQFMTNLSRPDASFGVEKQHRNCVRSVAVEALVKTKFVKKEVVKDKLASGYRFTCTLQVAGKVVDEVFDRCYADLEPIGRRARYQYFFPCLKISSTNTFSGMEMTLKELRMKNSCSVTANTNPVLYTQGCVN